MRYFYDFHLHSCLSPCADDEMTPNNIANYAKLLGLQIIALTDHNSCKNCAATAETAKQAGLVFLPGMELTTSEDTHIVCLFPDVEPAERFEELTVSRTPFVENRPEKMGHQYIMDELDNIICEERRFLHMAPDISTDDISKICDEFGGICYPAHIDRPSFSVISNLGFFPDNAGFSACEITANTNPDEFALKFPEIKNLAKMRSSDAHCLGDMQEPNAWIELPELSAQFVIDTLKNASITTTGLCH